MRATPSRVLWVIVMAGTIGAAAGCEPCAGTVSCNTAPMLAASGQFIDHESGAPVAGVTVTFIRRGGVPLEDDTVSAVSDADGTFIIRVRALREGSASGELRVDPPAPHTSYATSRVVLRTMRTRGGGNDLGRLVVNPYLVMVGEVRDRETGELIPGSTVTMKRVDDGASQPASDSLTIVSDPGGRLLWVVKNIPRGDSTRVEFEIVAPGFSRPYRFTRMVPVSYVDGRVTIITLPVGDAVRYQALTRRRGSGEALAGVRVEFRRTGGVELSADSLSLVARDDGSFEIVLRPEAAGTVVGDVSITPPAPYAPELFRDVALSTADGVFPDTALQFGYGAQVFFSAHFYYRATGEPVADGILGEAHRVGGEATLAHPDDRGLRLLSDAGRFVYNAATPDTTITIYNLIVHLNAPFLPETLKAQPIRSRFSDAPLELGPFAVGSWYPWEGTVLDAATNQPIAGASATFQRTGGAALTRAAYQSTSAADGRFPLRPVPAERGTVSGNLQISAPGYRTHSETVSLSTAQDGTIRSAGIFRLSRN